MYRRRFPSIRALKHSVAHHMVSPLGRARDRFAAHRALSATTSRAGYHREEVRVRTRLLTTCQ